MKIVAHNRDGDEVLAEGRVAFTARDNADGRDEWDLFVFIGGEETVEVKLTDDEVRRMHDTMDREDAGASNAAGLFGKWTNGLGRG